MSKELLCPFTCDLLVFSVSWFLYITAHGDGGTKIKKKPHMTPATVPMDTSMSPWVILEVKSPDIVIINVYNKKLKLMVRIIKM